ncbi:MAG: radical SAM protein [bacterium]|nr:radical SAM protein [bacterium]
MKERLLELLQGQTELAARLAAVRDWSRKVRTTEYHLTNACNIRCKGCWFFEYDFDRTTSEVTSLHEWKDFAAKEAERGITSALIVGGEPLLFPKRIESFVSNMPFVTVSSNGLQALPKEGFEDVNVALTLFGGGPLDDQIRGHHPNGSRLEGLFETALANYRGDDRAIFIFALSDDSAQHIESTVRRIEDNGNQVTFNYYSDYGSDDPLHAAHGNLALLEEALRVREKYPDTVRSTDYYIRALVTGRTEWGEFGYDVCPSISIDHPAHEARRKNGNPTLPLFNAWAADLETVNFCCTSGHCESCRDSQAVQSWLMMSLSHFLSSVDSLEAWLDLSESYWSQFVWSPYHRRAIANRP